MVEGKGTQLLFCGQRNAFLCLETIPNTEKKYKILCAALQGIWMQINPDVFYICFMPHNKTYY